LHRPKDNPPAPEIRRWTARLKAAIVAAVATGELSGEEACRIYGLSGEELVSWQRAFTGGFSVTAGSATPTLCSCAATGQSGMVN